MNGTGGNLGPDLYDIGFMRGAAYLRQAIVDPGAALPKGVLQWPSRGYAEYLPLRIVTKQGSEVRGIRVNEDAFTIQVRDQAGKFYSTPEDRPRTAREANSKSLMPRFCDAAHALGAHRSCRLPRELAGCCTMKTIIRALLVAGVDCSLGPRHGSGTGPVRAHRQG